jgi:KDO2-lipid IV(A) lauroyltransferase
LVGCITCLALLPRPLAYWLGARLGDVAYLILAGRRQIAEQNLLLALGDTMAPAACRRLVRSLFHTLGWHLVDFSRLRFLTRERFRRMCTVDGLERVQALLQRGKGLLILSAHFGSWELSPAVALCLDAPLHVIARPPDVAAFRRVVAEQRSRGGFHTMARTDALSASMRALRRGEAVAVLMDQSSLRREAVEVEFFGVKTFTSRGPALMALRTRCPVISAFLVREAPGRHRLMFGEEIAIRATGDLRQDIEETTRAFNRVIESMVRRYPDHWFWLHRRWKQRPLPRT